MQLSIAAEFARKFGGRTFCLNFSVARNNVTVEDGNVEINGLKYCLLFLRYVGSKIPKLELSGNDRNADIDQYVSTFCANTLRAIGFNYRLEFGRNNFSRPLTAVQCVRITECDLGPNLRHFAEWFPNLHHLKIYGGSRDYPSTRVHFPYLRHLSVTFPCIKLMQANLQIRSMELIVPMQQNIKFLNWIVFDGSLRKLSVEMCDNSLIRVLSAREVRQLINKHRLLLELNLSGFTLNAKDAILLLRGMNLLKKLRIRLTNRQESECFLKKLIDLLFERRRPMVIDCGLGED